MTAIMGHRTGVAHRPEMRAERHSGRFPKIGPTWFLVMLGVIATLAASAVVPMHTGVYWARVEVLFIAPQSKTNPNAFLTSTSAAVQTAGVVAAMVDPHNERYSVADADLNLADLGWRHGSTVTLPNSGGQWSLVFSSPWLNVDAVGTSPDEVRSEIAQRVTQVHRTLDAIQQSAGSGRQNVIRWQDSPAAPVIGYEGGSRARATVATLAVGALLTAGAVRWYRRRLTRRRPVTTPGR